ncbi:hypothetical protein IWX49DRAFT_630845 [Phyllosticta citricarpa]|uniref:Uncharacterized protein n=1 Tax=Phyllosticta citricarpa TaxID=55181 RepID=A0ABR1M7B6_9PEZI
MNPCPFGWNSNMRACFNQVGHRRGDFAQAGEKQSFHRDERLGNSNRTAGTCENGESMELLAEPCDFRRGRSRLTKPASRVPASDLISSITLDPLHSLSHSILSKYSFLAVAETCAFDLSSSNLGWVLSLQLPGSAAGFRRGVTQKQHLSTILFEFAVSTIDTRPQTCPCRYEAPTRCELAPTARPIWASRLQHRRLGENDSDNQLTSQSLETPQVKCHGSQPAARPARAQVDTAGLEYRRPFDDGAFHAIPETRWEQLKTKGDKAAMRKYTRREDHE